MITLVVSKLTNKKIKKYNTCLLSTNLLDFLLKKLVFDSNWALLLTNWLIYHLTNYDFLYFLKEASTARGLWKQKLFVLKP